MISYDLESASTWCTKLILCMQDPLGIKKLCTLNLMAFSFLYSFCRSQEKGNQFVKCLECAKLQQKNPDRSTDLHASTLWSGAGNGVPYIRSGMWKTLTESWREEWKIGKTASSKPARFLLGSGCCNVDMKNIHLQI